MKIPNKLYFRSLILKCSQKIESFSEIYTVINSIIFSICLNYTHFFISTWTFWQKPLLSTYCAYFFRQKPSCAMCLIFLKKKAFMCLFSQVNYIEKKPFLAKLCLWCAYFFRQKPSCAMCLIFSKKSLHVLMGPCAYKKNECNGRVWVWFSEKNKILVAR